MSVFGRIITTGAMPVVDTVVAMITADLMSAAWDDMAASAFTDEAKYQAAKARFDALLSEGY